MIKQVEQPTSLGLQESRTQVRSGSTGSTGDLFNSRTDLTPSRPWPRALVGPESSFSLPKTDARLGLSQPLDERHSVAAGRTAFGMDPDHLFSSRRPLGDARPDTAAPDLLSGRPRHSDTILPALAEPCLTHSRSAWLFCQDCPGYLSTFDSQEHNTSRDALTAGSDPASRIEGNWSPRPRRERRPRGRAGRPPDKLRWLKHGGASCTQRLLGNRIGEASHPEAKKTANTIGNTFSSMRPNTPSHLHTTSTHPPPPRSVLDSHLSRPWKPRLPLAFTPQPCPVTLLPMPDMARVAKNWTTKRGLNNHVEMHNGPLEGTGPRAVADGQLPSLLPSLYPAHFYRKPAMLLQVPPDFQQPRLQTHPDTKT